MNYLSKKTFSKLSILSSRINSAEDLNILLKLTIESVKELIPCESAFLLLINKESDKLESYITLEKPYNSSLTKKLEMKMAEEAVKKGSSIIKNKLPGILKSLLCVPMRLKSRTIGVLEIINANKGHFDDKDKNILMFIGSITAIGINNRTLFQNLIKANEDLDNRARELNYLYKLSLLTQKYQNSNDIFDAIIKGTYKLLKAEKAYLILADDKHFRILSAIGYDKKFIDSKISLTDDGNFEYEKTKINYADQKLNISVPIIIDEEIVGMVNMSDPKGKQYFSSSDLEVLKNVGSFIAKAYKSIKLRDKVAEQNRIKKEIEIAATLQNSFLPKTIPNIDKLDIAVFNNTKLDVSGNFYDFIEIDESKLAITMCKVFSKGVPAALSVALFKNLLRGQIRNNASPKSVLSWLNNQFLGESKTTMPIQTVYCIIDTNNYVITYAYSGLGVNFYLFNSEKNKLVSLECDKQKTKHKNLNEYMKKYNKKDFLLFWTEEEYIKKSLSSYLGKSIKSNKDLNSKQLLKHILNVNTNHQHDIDQLNTILIVKSS